jgi:hypothetical protein
MSARVTTLTLLSLLTGSPSCREPVVADTPGELVPATIPVAFVGVHVIPMDADRVLRDHVVLVRGGHIERVGPVGTVVIPNDAAIVQGSTSSSRNSSTQRMSACASLPTAARSHARCPEVAPACC